MDIWIRSLHNPLRCFEFESVADFWSALQINLYKLKLLHADNSPFSLLSSHPRQAWSHSPLMASSPYTSRLTCRGSEKRVTCQRQRCPSPLEQEGDGQSWPAVLQRNVKHFSRWASLSCKCRSDVLPLFRQHQHQTSQSHSSLHLDLLYFKRAEHHHLCDSCENMVAPEHWL